MSNNRCENRRRRWPWIALGAVVAATCGAGGLVRVASAEPGTASTLVPITPVRILDTRDPVNVGLAGPFVSAASQDLRVTGQIATTTGLQEVVPVGATGVSVNVTVVAPSAAGFLSVRPADAGGAPTTSSLNVAAGDIVPNAVTVQVPTTGADAGLIELTFDAYGAAGPTADVLVDVVGYYAAGGGAPGPAGPQGPAGLSHWISVRDNTTIRAVSASLEGTTVQRPPGFPAGVFCLTFPAGTQASTEAAVASLQNAAAGPGFITATISIASPPCNEIDGEIHVAVETWAANGTRSDRPFILALPDEE